MELSENHYYVHVTTEGCASYDVGPFDVSGGPRFSDGAIDWIYKQIGLLKSKYPNAELIKHKWDYRNSGSGFLGEEAVVDINVEIAGFTFEIVPLKSPSSSRVIDELIESEPTVQSI